MSKVLTLQLEIKEIENQIWKKIEISELQTVADLAYAILSTFDSLTYHFIDIEYHYKKYDYQNYLIVLDNTLLQEKIEKVKYKYEIEE